MLNIVLSLIRKTMNNLNFIQKLIQSALQKQIKVTHFTADQTMFCHKNDIQVNAKNKIISQMSL